MEAYQVTDREDDQDTPTRLSDAEKDEAIIWASREILDLRARVKHLEELLGGVASAVDTVAGFTVEAAGHIRAISIAGIAMAGVVAILCAVTVASVFA